jgi:hypothetical protein
MMFGRKKTLRCHTNVTGKTTRLEEKRGNNNFGVKKAASYESSILPGDGIIQDTAESECWNLACAARNVAEI